MKRIVLLISTLVLLLFLVTTPALAADEDPLAFDLSSLWYFGGVPLVVAGVQLIKMWIKDTRVYPIVAIGLGVGLDIVIGLVIGQSLIVSIIAGIVVGLMASGLYSGATTTGGTNGTTPGT